MNTYQKQTLFQVCLWAEDNITAWYRQLIETRDDVRDSYQRMIWSLTPPIIALNGEFFKTSVDSALDPVIFTYRKVHDTENAQYCFV